MLKIKFIAIIGIFVLVGIVLSHSRSFSTLANGDVLQEIAKYKTWNKITKEPIVVKTDEFVYPGG